MELLLRQYVRFLLEEEEKVLGEPDFPGDEDEEIRRRDKEQEEASGADAVAGVITPLGTGPDGFTRGRGPGYRSPAAAAGSAFGGAKPYKPPRKKKNKN